MTRFLCSLLLLAAVVLAAGQIQASGTPSDDLFRHLLSIFPERKIPDRYRTMVQQSPLRTCGTMLLAEARRRFDEFTPEQQAVLRTLFQRPNLPLNHLSTSGEFRIHYAASGADAVPLDDSDGSGIPDFVEAVAAAFDYSHQSQVGALGYRSPPADNNVDGPQYDIYLQDLGGYGFTNGEAGVPATSRNDLSSYIVIDNDFTTGVFTTGLPGAQVTAAHEYFHAVQFGYRTLETNEEQFYYEACSVWMEEELYDHINDYYQYLPIFFQRTDIPFNLFGNSQQFLHAYGEGLWNIFLVRRHQSGREMIRRSWEIMESGTLAIDAIDAALREQGTSFATEFVEFAFWNYFTGSRADPVNFYEESLDYPGIRISHQADIDDAVSVIDSSRGLTHQYYRFTVNQPGEYAVTGRVEQGASWLFATIVRESGFVRLFDFHPSIGQDLGTLAAGAEIVVIPVNLKVIDGPDLPLLDSSYLGYEVTVQPNALDSLDTVPDIEWYPNPFRPENGPFFVALNGEAEVHIFSADGRLVRTLRAEQFGTFSWDGTDERGQPVASGVYVVQIRGDRNAELKVAVVRN